MERRGRFSHDFGTAGEQGYVLLSLLLMASLLVIAAAAVAPRIAQQVQRDREEELIHRGMQYRRAIRAFAKSTGRFPTGLEELQNTNGTRFLRKAYKDPITGGEFRLLHPSDIQATGAGTNPGPQPDQKTSLPPDASASIGAAPATDQPQVDPAAEAQGTQAAAPGAPPAKTAGSQAASAEAAPADTVVLHGGLILGVASSSQKKTIREFDHKSRYDQWLFFYSAIYDGSYEVKGPTPTRPIFPAPSGSPDSSQHSGQPSP